MKRLFLVVLVFLLSMTAIAQEEIWVEFLNVEEPDESTRLVSIGLGSSTPARVLVNIYRNEELVVNEWMSVSEYSEEYFTVETLDRSFNLCINLLIFGQEMLADECFWIEVNDSNSGGSQQPQGYNGDDGFDFPYEVEIPEWLIPLGTLALVIIILLQVLKFIAWILKGIWNLLTSPFKTTPNAYETSYTTENVEAELKMSPEKVTLKVNGQQPPQGSCSFGFPRFIVSSVNLTFKGWSFDNSTYFLSSDDKEKKLPKKFLRSMESAIKYLRKNPEVSAYDIDISKFTDYRKAMKMYLDIRTCGGDKLVSVFKHASGSFSVEGYVCFNGEWIKVGEKDIDFNKNGHKYPVPVFNVTNPADELRQMVGSLINTMLQSHWPQG